ncbi:hypothetical protein [Amycolatopsis suaedae]|uniref:Uncharacterized protein n=1 Tax=Amycolatopsis suaedae TaxID=2510978 RepID=A0A4Q7J496_9PSEU|nr:hypothetical protein [Amycolatopsis suaedae]RZQ61506.1 hypothetical protein EWH70_24375 [Amycolatopsis suaedae]
MARVDASGRFSSKDVVEHPDWPHDHRFDIHVVQDTALLIPARPANTGSRDTISSVSQNGFGASSGFSRATRCY